MVNRLANATSPYLLQHQDNPVDWWEWSDDAFVEARRRDVPVLVSIGYAACHWCHVMAHESFEDPVTAEEMNRLFVNVKVDREERPDVDSVYMEATQAMTGHGGWPMTVFVDHERRPFFAGTYFPREPRHGMPSFRQLLAGIAEAWAENRPDVSEQARRIVEAVTTTIPRSSMPGPSELTLAYQAIEAIFDPVHGGFGRAPKFPQQPVLEFLLRVHTEDWAPRASGLLELTLERMAQGGIRDHLGGGFARYSVDERWLVPHFEKMLYDNAQLARIYLWAGVELGRDDFLDVARDTIGYMLTDLRHPDGGFFSSEDADSEGQEGKFYIWSIEEIAETLGPDAPQVIAHFGVTAEGNFEGSNILSVVGHEPPPVLARARAALLAVRNRRVRPGLDDKVIVSWNGLAIRAMVEAGAALQDPGLVDEAARTATFIMDNLVVEGRLMRSWRNGRTSVPAFLDDHASLAIAMFCLYSATADPAWYRTASWLIEEMRRFERAGGGFFTTPSDAMVLFKRPFDITDNPMPSGNALAGEAMLLAHLFTGESQMRDTMESAIGAAAGLTTRYPTMIGHHLSVAHSAGRAKELALVGPGWRSLAHVYYRRFRPHVAMAASPAETAAVPLLDGRAPGQPAVAYVCRGFVCELPTSDPGTLSDLLET